MRVLQPQKPRPPLLQQQQKEEKLMLEKCGLAWHVPIMLIMCIHIEFDDTP